MFLLFLFQVLALPLDTLGVVRLDSALVTLQTASAIVTATLGETVAVILNQPVKQVC